MITTFAVASLFRSCDDRACIYFRYYNVKRIYLIQYAFQLLHLHLLGFIYFSINIFSTKAMCTRAFAVLHCIASHRTENQMFKGNISNDDSCQNHWMMNFYTRNYKYALNIQFIWSKRSFVCILCVCVCVVLREVSLFLLHFNRFDVLLSWLHVTMWLCDRSSSCIGPGYTVPKLHWSHNFFLLCTHRFRPLFLSNLWLHIVHIRFFSVNVLFSQFDLIP